LNLTWVNYNFLSRDDISEKGNFLQLESTLAEFDKELIVPKSLQNNAEMSRMLFFTLGIDQDVVNEDHDKFVQLRHEYGVHQVYEMCRSIVSPNDITKYSYNPYLVERAVLETSFGRILI
jgi:hypothetical protein